MLVDEVLGAVGAERLLVGDGGVDEGAARAGTRRRRAVASPTAIDAVRLSMSTAPRPHTSSTPSSVVTSSPPNGSCCHRVLVGRHDVGVTEQQQRRRGRVGALDARDEVAATR